MFLDVFIGELDSPCFKWDGGDWSGNIPENKHDLPAPDNVHAFWYILAKIDRGIFEGKQTDWAGWVAKVNKRQIADLLTELYSARDQIVDVEALIPYLEEGKVYALVCAEG